MMIRALLESLRSIELWFITLIVGGAVWATSGVWWHGLIAVPLAWLTLWACFLWGWLAYGE